MSLLKSFIALGFAAVLFVVAQQTWATESSTPGIDEWEELCEQVAEAHFTLVGPENAKAAQSWPQTSEAAAKNILEGQLFRTSGETAGQRREPTLGQGNELSTKESNVLEYPVLSGGQTIATITVEQYAYGTYAATGVKRCL
jgi:hypothetical protein